MKRIFLTFLFILGINNAAHAGIVSTITESAKNHPLAASVTGLTSLAALGYLAYQTYQHKQAKVREENRTQFKNTINYMKTAPKLESSESAANTLYQKLQSYWNSLFGK